MADSFRYLHAARVVRDGGIIAYPTEAVFGLGCDPHNPVALEALLKLKHRPARMGLILICASIDVALRYIDQPDEELVKKLHRSWPGPTTWVVPAAGLHPLVTGGRDTVALRVSAHPVCQGLCSAFGDALVSTSANVSGKAPARTALQLRRQFPEGIDLIVGGALGDSSQPTRIIDSRSGKVLRAG